MKRSPAFLLLACSIVCFAQAPQIKSGATVYIEPTAGYETYLAAAMVKQHVPLALVEDKEKADYIIRSTVTQTTPSQPTVVVNNTNANGSSVSNRAPDAGGYGAALAAARSTSTSISMVDTRSSVTVFAFSADHGGFKGAAETCAKHLKEFIEKKK